MSHVLPSALRHAARQLAWMLPVVALFSTGCATMPGGLDDLFASLPQEEPAEGAPALVIEYHSLNQLPKSRRIAWSEGMTVTDALASARAANRFGHMTVAVLRNSPEDQRQQVMQVRWNNSKKTVDAMTDYALRSGDRVVLKEVATNPLAEAFGPLVGQLY